MLTGADYAMFTYGPAQLWPAAARTALRIFGMLAGAAMGYALDIGGGSQVGVSTLVRPEDRQVVWYNLLAISRATLRDEEGSRRRPCRTCFTRCRSEGRAMFRLA
jgi:hypothetical protein